MDLVALETLVNLAGVQGKIPNLVQSRRRAGCLLEYVGVLQG